MAEMPRFVLYEDGRPLFGYLSLSVWGTQLGIRAFALRQRYIMGEDVQLITLGYQGLTVLINHCWASVPVPGLDHPGAERPELASPPRLEIDRTEGTLALGADGWMRLFSDSGYQEWYFSEDTRPASRAAAQQHFIDYLESGAEFEASGAETLKTMGLVYACYQSAEENQTVDLS